MSIFDDDNEDATQEIVGGLSLLGKLRGKFNPQGNNSGEHPWKQMWDARGGFPFSMRRGESCKVVMLADIQLFVASPLLVDWVEAKNFPKLDYVRSPAYDDKCEPTGKPCLIQEVTGFQPTLMGVAPILDLREYKDKAGEVHKYSIRPLLIKSETVLNQFLATSKHYKKPLNFMKMTVTRSMDSKSAGTGDSWFGEKIMDVADIRKSIPDFDTELAKIDLDKGYPRPDDALIMELLRLHVSRCEKFKDKGNRVTNYNKERWDELTGKQPAPRAAEQFAGLTEETRTDGSTLVRTDMASTNDFDLDEIDSILG